MPYFVGNVLPSSSDPGEDDPTFDFTNAESRQMNLRDVPIRIEHEEGLAIGSVQRDWTDSDGKKWILGKVDCDTLEGRYASHAIQPSSTGHTLYKGLSLQHVHTSFSNGSTAKRPIEVSICMEPRRPGCDITCVDRSKKKEYITHLASSQNMSAPVVETTPETTTETFSEPASETMNAPAAEENVDNREELMKLVIDQESELSGTKTALERAQSELQKLQSAWSERENNEKLQTKSKAEALSKALVDSWTASLPADMMTDDNKKAIYALAQNFPQESVKMMEIAHKASKKYKQDLDSLAAQQQVKQKRALESRVHDIVTKKRRIAAPDTRSVVHAASVKKANPFAFDASRTSSSAMSGVRDRNPDLFKALSGFSSGNLRDRMGQIANINGN